MPNDQLVVLVPSRGRPENMQALYEVWGGDADLMVPLDDDDLSVYPSFPRDVPRVWSERLPRRRLGPTLNYCAAALVGTYRYIGFMGDDHRPRTDGWASLIRDQLASMGTGIVYGDDLLRGELLPTAVFMTSDIVRELGYMVPTGLIHMYLDNFWRDLGQALGCLQYMPDVVIEHMHFTNGKSVLDDTYKETNQTEILPIDEQRYESYRKHLFDYDVERLRHAIPSLRSR